MPGIHPDSVAVLGVPINNVSMDEAVSIIEEKIDQGGFHQIATANADFLMNAINDQELQDILCSCSLVVPDGMPILWSARLMGTPLKERVSGIDLVPRLAELSARRGFRIYLLGASEKSSARAAELLQQQYPGLQIVGRYSPPLRPLEQMNHEEILHRIELARPDILLVAFGNPKQEKWLSMHRDRLRVPVSIGIGGSLDMIAGKLARAPRWMQDSGLEWLFRACQEPRRLVGRYVSDAITLGRYLPWQVAATASQPRNSGPSQILTTRVGNTEVISIQGNLTGELLAEFEDRTEIACLEGRHIVLNMAESAYFGPQSLGALIKLMTAMHQLRLQLWLAGMRPHLVRLLKSARLECYFRTTSTVGDALYRIERASENTLVTMPTLQTVRRRTSRPIQVRVERMQEICQRIAAVNEAPEFDFGGGFAESNAYGFKATAR
ncbi:WecB/TagA/CpsF family glycosyltransferase [Silvibacterium acidisoli]|uniref:WecB/TagA/CpsF family glycosyltransferase n=1 Tax=Acidobacteriaceae bacterium ZG23-2 TaxID=2883246 RepID=UPI00406C22B9